MSTTAELPRIGTIVGGADDAPMLVVKHCEKRAGEYTFVERGEEKTLTQAHGSAPDDPVVECIYFETLDRVVPNWRAEYADQPREKFVNWLFDTYCRKWRINDSVLKRYGYAIGDLHDIGDTETVTI